MTSGGPNNSTTTLIYKLYKDGFAGMDLGSSSAQSVLLMAMVIALTLIQFRYLEKKVTLSMRQFKGVISHSCLCLFIVLLFLPLYLALVAASHDSLTMMQSPLPIWPGFALFHNIKTVLTHGLTATGGEPVWRMLVNSFFMAIFIAGGKITLALLSAFALVYFRFPLKRLCFALIFATMMLPIEVRIIPTFQVVAAFGWLNSFAGLSLPLMASATATFLFRQFFKTVPQDLVDAATLDGAGPCRFFIRYFAPFVKNTNCRFVHNFVCVWLESVFMAIDNDNGQQHDHHSDGY